MKKLKILVIACFSFFAVSSFLLMDKTSEAAKKGEPILEAVANYKNWTQVNKKEPEKPLTDVLAADTFKVDFSSVAG